MKSISEKRGAMEMSVGTIVTIVLLMGVLVLGIFLVQKIFRSGTNAIDTLDSEIQNQISKLFAEEGKDIAVYPTSREITVKRGDDPKGFAFSIRNSGNDEVTYNYNVTAYDADDCGAGFSKEDANDLMLGDKGLFVLSPGESLELPRLVKFDIPEGTPPCTIIYYLQASGGPKVLSADIYVTIK